MSRIISLLAAAGLAVLVCVGGATAAPATVAAGTGVIGWDSGEAATESVIGWD
ncbi:hypothetical protein ACFY4K_18980 [Streptomyces leeuwenhoekii]|uniref:hypothetical protein n=1 Tax=Streptomyces leeuwenhoekii TaxID=1437453 RepID=UPI0036784506